ncbi:MAG: PAS domain S-box protein, partial [Xenococcaceae cyanobacterium]
MFPNNLIDRSPLIVAANTPALEAIALMSDREVGCIWVVENSQLLGMLTEREALKLSLSGLDLASAKITEIMTRSAIAIESSKLTDPSSTLSLLQQNNAAYLPVIDDRGQFLGSIEGDRICRILNSDKAEIEKKSLYDNTLVQAIFNSAPECIKVITQDGALVEMNPAGLAMLEADSSDLVIGKSVCEIIAQEYRPAFQKLTDKVFQGESGKLEFEIVGLKGKRIWLETHAVPLRDRCDEIIACLSITRDITDRKQAELEKQKYITELSELYDRAPCGYHS